MQQKTNRMPSRMVSMLILILVNVMWGLSFIFSKTALEEGMPAMTLAFVRYVIAALVMLPICLHQEKSIRLGKWTPLAFITAMLGITVYYFFEYSGLQRTTASAASLILALVPMMTLLWRVVFRHERMSLLRWVCVLLSLIGAFFVICSGNSDGAGTLVGNLLMVAACLCWTGYIIISPPLMQNNSSMRVNTWQAIVAAFTLAPLALAERHAWTAVSLKAWIYIFLLAVFCSAICYVLYGVAIRTIDSLTVSLTININPIAACIGGALVLGEALSGAQLLGGALIVLSVLLDTLESSGVFARNKG